MTPSGVEQRPEIRASGCAQHLQQVGLEPIGSLRLDGGTRIERRPYGCARELGERSDCRLARHEPQCGVGLLVTDHTEGHDAGLTPRPDAGTNVITFQLECEPEGGRAQRHRVELVDLIAQARVEGALELGRQGAGQRTVPFERQFGCGSARTTPRPVTTTEHATTAVIPIVMTR